MISVAALVFPRFETLELFGPIQMFGSANGAFRSVTVAENAGIVHSRHGQGIEVDQTFADATPHDLLLVPGGPGTWEFVDNPKMLGWIRDMSATATVVMSVCTGAAYLVYAGLLDGRSATTNKIDYDWVTQFGKNVHWKSRARWVEDGKFFTSSGVSAGMDMSLAVIEKLIGPEAANQAALHSEYLRVTDPDNDPFARQLDLA